MMSIMSQVNIYIELYIHKKYKDPVRVAETLLKGKQNARPCIK